MGDPNLPGPVLCGRQVKANTLEDLLPQDGTRRHWHAASIRPYHPLHLRGAVTRAYRRRMSYAQHTLGERPTQRCLTFHGPSFCLTCLTSLQASSIPRGPQDSYLTIRYPNLTGRA